MPDKNHDTMDKNWLAGRLDMKEAIYEKLKDMIMRRDFTPNERIDAAEIAEKFGISRTPVRDALNMLDAEGFIKTVPRQGIYVKGIYRQDLIELFQYREMVELFALDTGFDALIKDLKDISADIHRFETFLISENYDGYQVMDSDIKLHKTIVASTRNKVIMDYYDKVNGHVQMARAYYLQDLQRIKQAHLEHKSFLQALEEGDKEGAKLHLKQHLEQTLANLLTIIDIYKVF
ncbi:GntR family transcriptional regulator [Cohnella silvisoli]|uniref:GntR family transcriptional regulator n=1 Tax=Cohnella silvisoli TaxID=2873699 RepID=A0ABV1KWZ1_9BACL|nr:GntR family transcriptional regulator [Cohnella silvisoli]MCD9023778.1 GntR family transcriptional regulator [Cohnella silvisoli]